MYVYLHLQKHPHEATDMLNLFKTMIIPISHHPFSAHIAHLTIVSVTTLIEIAV
jgi:hypothetical protein